MDVNMKLPETSHSQADEFLTNKSIGEWSKVFGGLIKQLADKEIDLFHTNLQGKSEKDIENWSFLHYTTTVLMMSEDTEELTLQLNFDNAKHLVAAGMDLDEFAQTMKSYNYSDKCNCVWHTDSIAYRCYTCARNPCMSLCAECFEKGDHSTHDYSRFFSQSGGACDCGNEDILDPSGFCSSHVPNQEHVDIPRDLLLMPKFIITKVFLRLLSGFRPFWQVYSETKEKKQQSTVPSSECILESVAQSITEGIEDEITFLAGMVELGRPMVECIAELILDKGFYRMINSKEEGESSHLEIAEMEMISKKFPLLQKCIDRLRTIESIETLDFLNIDFESTEVKCECILDELIFYMIQLGFPQNLINFLLSLLPHDGFKRRFSCTFFRWYSLIDTVIMDIINDGEASRELEPGKVAARVVHVSVQICSSKNVCLMLQKEVNVLRRVMDSTIRYLYSSATNINGHHAFDVCKNKHPSRGTDINRWKVFNANDNVYNKKSGYWYLPTDLQNLFAHFDMAKQVFQSADLTKRYIALISATQGASVMWRIASGDHAEADNSMILQKFFTTEWEINMCMFSSTVRLTEREKKELKKFGEALMDHLKVWFDVVGVTENNILIPPFFCILHIPLHRQFAAAALQSVKITGSTDLVLPSDEELLSSLLIHPLRIQAMASEFFARMWVRNGAPIRNVIYLYNQTNLTHGFLDLDMALIRIVCSKLNGWKVMKLFFDAFHLHDCFNFDVYEKNAVAVNDVIKDKDFTNPMFDGFLKLLLEVLLLKSYVEMTIEDEVRAEVVHIISSHQQTYSKLRQALPDRGPDYSVDCNKIFEKILAKVATFDPPDQGNEIQQGMYMLTSESWYKEFDPIRGRFRSNSLREYQALVLRNEYMVKDRLADASESRLAWLPFVIPNFNESPLINTYHILLNPGPLWVCKRIISNAVSSSATVTQHLIQQAIYVLTLMVSYASFSTRAEDFNYLYVLDYHDRIFDQLPVIDEQLSLDDSKSLFFSLFNEHGSRFSSIYSEDDDSLLLQLTKFYRQLHSHEYKGASVDVANTKLLQSLRQDPSTINKIVGSGTDYVARLLCILYQNDEHSHNLLDEKLGVSALPSTSNDSAKDGKNDFMRKKLVAKRKQQELMKMIQAQSKALLNKFMKSEEMEVDTSEEVPVESQFDCPICNGSQNDSDASFGLFVFIQSTSVAADLTSTDAVSGTSGETLNYTRWELYQHGNLDDFVLFTPGELKSCGHHAHISCFEQYHHSVESVTRQRLTVPCPVCRSNVTAQIPLGIQFKDDLLPSVYWSENVLSQRKDGLTNTILTFFDAFKEILKKEENVQILKSYFKQVANFLTKYFNINNHFECLTDGLERKQYNKALITEYERGSAYKTLLSIVRNNIDRISETITAGYNYPTRLRSLMTDSLFKLALHNNNNYMSLCNHSFTFWKNVLAISGDEHNFVLNMESSTILLYLVAPIVSHPGVSKDLLRFCFRNAYIYMVGHCYVRALITISFKSGNNALLEKCKTSSESEIKVIKAVIEKLNCNGSQSCNGVDYFGLIEKALIKFAVFALNLMIEIKLLDSVADDVINHSTGFQPISNAILGQSHSLDQILDCLTENDKTLSEWFFGFNYLLKKTLPEFSEKWVSEIWWKSRRLLKPHQLFDTFFSTYYGQKCLNCEMAPTHALICMLCNTVVCLDDCCNKTVEGVGEIAEIEQHSCSCSSGVACFISLTSSVAVVVQQGVCCVWGSLYLDSHGEEDRNLRRGRKLTLSEVRFNKLQELWINHEFERVIPNNVWTPVDNLSLLLRECHLLFN